MPSTYEIDPRRRLILITVRGELTDEKLLEIYDRLRHHPDVKPDFSVLVDLHQASGRKVTALGVRALAERPALLAPEARRAIVVPTNLGFGMARMYELSREAGTANIRVFRDLAEAKRWLQLEEES